MLKSGWILLFLGFWAWRLAAETHIAFPKDTQLTARAQTAIVEALTASCAIATDYASLNLVNEERRENPDFDLYMLRFEVQYEGTQVTDLINLRLRDYRKKRGGFEVFDIHSSNGMCFYRGLFLTKMFNDAMYEFEPFMKGLEVLRGSYDTREMNMKLKFNAYDTNDFLRTEKRIAELVWREVYGVSGVEPFPCGKIFKGDYKAGKTQDGYVLEAAGKTAVDTCYNEEIAKDWRYKVTVRLSSDNRSGELELFSTRKPEAKEKENKLLWP